jgi:two-component system, NarL family, invasion response regulator UvrY
MEQTMINVLIADDHAIVRQGLKQIIAETSDLVVTGEATSGSEALDMAARNSYDVAVLDLSMPGRGGLETIRLLRDLHPSLPILVLSMYPEEQFAVRALRAGASGYLTKASAPEELINALRRVASGRRYITESLAESLARDLEKPVSDTPHQDLSDREFQVMRMIASGLTISEIADQLALSVKTVSTYRERILVKMQMRTNAELTHYSVVHNLLD